MIQKTEGILHELLARDALLVEPQQAKAGNRDPKPLGGFGLLVLLQRGSCTSTARDKRRQEPQKNPQSSRHAQISRLSDGNMNNSRQY